MIGDEQNKTLTREELLELTNRERELNRELSPDEIKEFRLERRAALQAAFLAAYRQSGVIRTASEAAGVSRKAARYWKDVDPTWAERFAEANEEAIERWEEEAVRRAVEGVWKYKFHKGQMIMIPENPDDPNSKMVPYREHEFSDNLLMFKLKAARPEKYRDNLDVTTGGQPITVKILQNVSMSDL